MLLKLRLSEISDSGENCIGYCLDCGCDSEGCEPDLCRGKCRNCGSHQLYGIDSLVANDWVEILDDEDYD